MLIDLDGPCTQAEVAHIVGVTQQSISALTVEGKLPVGVSLGDAVLAYCHRLREQAAGRMGSEVGGLDLAQERAALAREQRLGIEIKNAVARGEYAPINTLAEVLASASQAVVEKFEQLPGMLTKACPELSAEGRQKLMAALAVARNEWVRSTEQLVSVRVQDVEIENDEVQDV